MVITGDNSAPGTALLLAAAPAGKGRLIDAASVLPSLAAVPAEVLTGSANTPDPATATVVELADPLDPQTVLTRIRAAAAAPGPLFLYLAGQLHLDRKQRRLHFALARSTPTTLRYTALPWHWLAAELGPRPPGSTTVVVDLVADGEAWQQVGEGRAALGPSVLLYGRAVPAPGRRNLAQPAYLRAMAEIWRSGARPPLAELHEAALSRAEPVDGALLFPPAPTTAPPVATPYAPPPVATPPGQAPVPAAQAGPTAAASVPAASVPPSSSPQPPAQPRSTAAAPASGPPAPVTPPAAAPPVPTPTPESVPVPSVTTSSSRRPPAHHGPVAPVVAVRPPSSAPMPAVQPSATRSTTTVVDPGGRGPSSAASQCQGSAV
ncbi:hypothetical protein [Streptomyces sp. t39]|uniref:hypothetical protein n=1 Tax=Streptomyces sp. t39 TaxID=1828156 RepID=UPI0021CA6D9D|nr:hypothetical protein [Streptomyces sp. t39]